MMRKGAISQNVNQHITSFINKSSEFGGEGGWEKTAKLHSTLSDLLMFLTFTADLFSCHILSDVKPAFPTSPWTISYGYPID